MVAVVTDIIINDIMDIMAVVVMVVATAVMVVDTAVEA
jgi:hypothetical protein